MGKSKKVKVKKGAQEPSPEVETPAAHTELQESPAEIPITTRKSKKAPAPKVVREERNGVKRPGPGKCLEVWDYLDQHGDMEPNDMKAVADEKGLNRNNCLIELYQWRRWSGITRSARK